MWLCLSVFFLLIESRWQAVGHLHACMQGWKGEGVIIKIDSRVDQCLKSRKLFVLPVTWGTQHSGTVKKEKRKTWRSEHEKTFQLKSCFTFEWESHFLLTENQRKKISKTEKSLIAFGKNQTGHVFYILTFQLWYHKTTASS